MRKRAALLAGSSVDSVAVAGGHDAIAAQRQADGSLRPPERKPEGIGSIAGYFEQPTYERDIWDGAPAATPQDGTLTYVDHGRRPTE